MLSIRPREALAELLAMGRRANRFFDAQAPWKSRKENPEEARAALYACAILLGSIAYHLAPYVPEAVGLLQGFFDGPIARVSGLEKLPEAYRVEGAKPLFARIEDADVAAAEEELSRAVRCTIYLTEMGDFAEVNEVYAEYFGESLPARVAFGVAALPKGGLVEIDAIIALER